MPWGTFLVEPSVHVLPCDDFGNPLEGHVSHASCECMPRIEKNNADGHPIWVHKHDN